MADCSGLKAAAQAEFACPDIILPDVLEQRRAGLAGAVVGRHGQAIVLITFAYARCEPAGNRIGEIVFGAEGAKGLLLLRVGPGLGEVVFGVRCTGNDRVDEAKINAGPGLVEVVVLMADVGGDAEVVSLVVQAQAEHVEGAFFIVDVGVAVALGGVQAHPEALLLAKATSYIGGDHALAAVLGA